MLVLEKSSLSLSSGEVIWRAARRLVSFKSIEEEVRIDVVINLHLPVAAARKLAKARALLYIIFFDLRYNNEGITMKVRQRRT